MTSRNARLAVLLRKAQWLFDDAAHRVGGGRMSSEECTALAEVLDEMATAVREHADDLTPATIEVER